MRSAALFCITIASCTGPSRTGPADPGEAPPPPVVAAFDASTPPAVAAGDAGPPPAEQLAMPWLSDDVPAAMAQAKRDKKLVFVDAWAKWCHTCLSMKHYVFTQPALAPLAELAVFVEVDTDRDENAAFVDKYAIDVWPTFFVIEPESGDILGYWPGAGSVKEMDGFVREAVDAGDARRKKTLKPGSPLALLLDAKDLQARSQYGKAASLYAKTLEKAPKIGPGGTKRSGA